MSTSINKLITAIAAAFEKFDLDTEESQRDGNLDSYDGTFTDKNPSNIHLRDFILRGTRSSPNDPAEDPMDVDDEGVMVAHIDQRFMVGKFTEAKKFLLWVCADSLSCLTGLHEVLVCACG